MPKQRYAPLTGSKVLDDIVGAIGWDDMLTISRAFGGEELYVPLKCGGEHKIVQAVGLEIAEKLCNFYGNTKLLIPNKFRREAEIRHLKATRGELTLNQIARMTNTHCRTVCKILASPPRAISLAERASLPLQTRQIEMFAPSE